MSINYGTRQGFSNRLLTYACYLKQAGTTARYYTFGDDTVLVYSGRDSNQLQAEINDDLSRYLRWLQQNKLKPKLMKASYMLFKQKNKVEANSTVECC